MRSTWRQVLRQSWKDIKNGYTRRPAVNLALPAVPLYELHPLPWWARWTIPLLVGNAVFTIGTAELIYNHWTESSSDPDLPPAGTLKPHWQRISAFSATTFIGSFLGMMIYASRYRIVRKLWVLPPLPGSEVTKIGERQVFIQSITNRKYQGQLFQYKKCKLMDPGNRGKIEEMVMKVDGIRGFFPLILSTAKINGEQMTEKQSDEDFRRKWARNELINAWKAAAGEGAENKSRPLRFTSGPAATLYT